MCRAGVEPYLVAGLRAGQGWGQGQFECCCHQAAPQQAPQSPPEEQLPLQLHSQVQTPLWCFLSLQDMNYFVMQTMPAKHNHVLKLKVASHAVWLKLLRCAEALHIRRKLQEQKKRKDYTLGATCMRSQVLHWAAQASFRNDFMVRSGKDRVVHDAK